MSIMCKSTCLRKHACANQENFVRGSKVKTFYAPTSASGHIDFELSVSRFVPPSLTCIHVRTVFPVFLGRNSKFDVWIHLWSQSVAYFFGSL